MAKGGVDGHSYTETAKTTKPEPPKDEVKTKKKKATVGIEPTVATPATATPATATEKPTAEASFDKEKFLSEVPLGWNKAYSDELDNDNIGFYKSVKKVKKEFGVTIEEAEDMLNAISIFTGKGYSAMREAAQDLGGADDAFVKRVNALESYIEKAPKFSGVTYRGLAHVSKSDIDSWLWAYKHNDYFDMKGMSSWSNEREIAEAFMRSEKYTRAMFVCKNGQPMGTSIAHLSEAPYENEVLASRHARWKITSYKYSAKEDLYEFQVEAVEPNYLKKKKTKK